MINIYNSMNELHYDDKNKDDDDDDDDGAEYG